MYRPVDAVTVRMAVLAPTDAPGLPDLTDRQSWRPWLFHVLSISTLAAAVEQASPALTHQIRAIRDGGQVTDRDARRAALAVARYVLRATSRATPFGLFAGVAVARLAPVGAVRIGAAHQAVARVSAEWLTAVVDQLERDPALRPHLTVRANNLLTERGGQLVLEHRASDVAGGAPTHISGRLTSPVRAVLSTAADAIGVDQLVAKVATDLGQDPAIVEGLIAQLIARRFLLTCLRPRMTDPNPVQSLAESLGAVLQDVGDRPVALAHAGEVLDSLRDIVQVKACHDQSSTWADAGAHRQQLVESLASVQPTTRPPLSVDLRLGCDVAVPQAVATEAARAASVLVRLARPATNGWAAWHSRFLERFGPHALVPVLDAVNPDIGLGYPAGYLGAPPLPAPTIGDRDRKLLALAQKATRLGQLEIVLDDGLIADLNGDDTVTSVQPTTALTVRVNAASLEAIHDGDFQLAIVAVSRTASTAVGRFLDLFDATDRERIADQLSELPAAVRGALPAQITAVTPYVATLDVARAPQVPAHAIPVGEYHDTGPHQIALADIAVTADVHGVYLVWLSRRCLLEPTALNAVEPVHHTLPLVRFLSEAPTALSTPCTTFDWGAAACLPYLPALRYGRTVLSPARWLLSADDLPGRSAGTTAWDDALSHWLHAMACPARVFLGDGDQRIPVDLTEPAHRVLLRDELRRTGTATLRAGTTASSAGWIGGRAHEIVIPLATTLDPAPPPRLPARLDPVAVRHHGLPPGDPNCLYIKLYGHRDRQTTIMAEHLPLLVDALGPDDRWWFLRYQDPEPHLRLRLRLATETAGESIHAWLRRLREAGLIARAQFDTDFPETARFGGPTARDAAERYFAADSAAALAELVAARHRHGPDVRALLAASLLDHSIAMVGDVEAAMRWLIERTKPHRPAPARPVYDQAIALANPHSQKQLTTLTAGARVASSWHERRRALDAYRASLSDAGHPPTLLLPDLLHLHHTRIAGPDPDCERACLHLARAAALSWRARGRPQP
jgi:thiopeptide-type bacteriocin biosynthesis protein